MNKDDRCLIDEMLKGVRAEIKAKDDIIMMKLEQILAETRKTNGRVTALEEQTSIVRWFERNPKRFTLIAFFMLLLSAKGSISIVEMIINKL